jgi:hypothetical protein
MSKDLLRYDRMVESALRGVVRQALEHVAGHGLPGAHHFYITFRTAHAGVEIPDYLQMKYPEEMTIVLEHQFWDLEVGDGLFSVTLTFQNRPERLIVPLAAITAFADPSVKFGLQFQENAPEPALAARVERDAPKLKLADGSAPGADEARAAKDAAKDGDKKSGEVVTLDQFRKK